MLKSALTKIRTHLVVTVAATVCAAVAVVALGFTVYNALCLVVIPVAASALTALIFLLMAAGALLVLQIGSRRPEPPEPVGAAAVLASIDWARVGPLAGQVALAVAAMMTDRAARRRGKDQDRKRK